MDEEFKIKDEDRKKKATVAAVRARDQRIPHHVGLRDKTQ
jgi:hypothetical protein